MGNGQIPGPADEIGNAIALDDGTLPRTRAPVPGPVGLDAKGGGAKGSDASLGDQIVSFPRRRRGERVGDGECFTLADRALRAAGARSAADYGPISPEADYVWGRSIALADLQPGDLIQFRGYRYDREIVTEDSSGTSTDEDFQERPHHTAIVERVDGNGAVTVLEQNSPPGAPVTRNQLFFTAGTRSSGRTTTTIRVRGTFWFYRAETR
jgi:hypothetical protein